MIDKLEKIFKSFYIGLEKCLPFLAYISTFLYNLLDPIAVLIFPSVKKNLHSVIDIFKVVIVVDLAQTLHTFCVNFVQLYHGFLVISVYNVQFQRIFKSIEHCKPQENFLVAHFPSLVIVFICIIWTLYLIKHFIVDVHSFLQIISVALIVVFFFTDVPVQLQGQILLAQQINKSLKLDKPVEKVLLILWIIKFFILFFLRLELPHIEQVLIQIFKHLNSL